MDGEEEKPPEESTVSSSQVFGTAWEKEKNEKKIGTGKILMHAAEASMGATQITWSQLEVTCKDLHRAHACKMEAKRQKNEENKKNKK